MTEPSGPGEHRGLVDGTRRAPRPIRAQRAAEVLASVVRDRILSGELDGGLPKEATLLEEFGVSRPTLREGLRILETEGLIQTRRGKHGGATVRRPTFTSAAYHLGLALQGARVDVADLAAARRLLEPMCVLLVAQRADREEIAARLLGILDEGEKLIGRGPEFTANSLQFHAAIVDSCANETMKILVGTLETVWQGQEQVWAAEASAQGAYPDEEGQRLALQSHRRIARRIGSGDGEGATRASWAHLSASMSYVCSISDSGGDEPPPGLLGRVVDASPLRS